MSINVRQFILDAVIKILSKKFIVWIIASIALFTRFIESSEWMAITMTYLGAQGFIDWKSSGRNINENINRTSTASAKTDTHMQQMPTG